MAKNSRKKRNKKKKMNRNRFISRTCEKCLACGDLTDAEFCFDVMYLKNSKIFMDHCFVLLTALEEWSLDPDEVVATENLDLFESIFCQSNMCGFESENSRCDNVHQCLEAFQEQIFHSYGVEDADKERGQADCSGMSWTGLPKKKYQRSQKGKKGKKGKKVKVKPQPTAVFFCNDPKKWAPRIQKVLYGNNNSQQNKAAGAAG